jgi:SAM-dependent methyltransferase
MTAETSIEALRNDLTAADFTVERLTDLWGVEAEAALHRGHRVAALRALDAAPKASAAGILARLFVLGVPVDRGALAEALPHLGLGGALELELVAFGADDHVVPLLDLRPYSFTDAWGAAAWWIASDLGEVALGGALGEKHVLGIGGASLTLSGLMLDSTARTALDLGTGCGIQAMHASRFAGRVIATDISGRALELARMNAALNGIRTIEFRLGSLFEPVAGELFDRIVSNPPFVITPRTPGVPAYEYRDGGLEGDAIVAEVIAGAARHLNPGGTAQLLGNWEYPVGRDGLERVSGWLDETNLDAWVIEREVQDAALYSETWIRDGGTASGAEFDRLTDAWLADFERRQVIKVGFGYLTLRKPPAGSAPTLRRIERLDGPVSASLGPTIAATLAAHDWHSALDDAALARAMLTVAPDVTEERHYWPGDEHPAVMNLRQGGGFARSYPLDTALAALIGACDGELSVAAICGAIAQLLSTPESPILEGDLLEQLLPTVRELIEVGILAS